METTNGTAHSHSPKSECEYYLPVPASGIAEGDDGVYVVDRLIAENEVTCAFGLPKSLKSYLALKLALDVVDGRSFFDLATRQGDVLYIDAETKPGPWRKRVGKIVRGLGKDDGVPPSRLKYMRAEKGSFGDRAKVQKILATIKAMEVQPILTILDSFQFATGINPLDPQDVTRVYGYLADFGTVLVLDHERAPRQGDDKAAAKAFGSVYKTASVDAHFHVISEVSGENEKRVTIEMVGSRDDSPLPAFGAVATFASDKRSVVFAAVSAGAATATTGLDDRLLELLRKYSPDRSDYAGACRNYVLGELGKGAVNAFTRLNKKGLVGSFRADDGSTGWYAKR